MSTVNMFDTTVLHPIPEYLTKTRYWNIDQQETINDTIIYLLSCQLYVVCGTDSAYGPLHYNCKLSINSTGYILVGSSEAN